MFYCLKRQFIAVRLQKMVSCQHIILHLIEYWRQAPDNGDIVGTIAIDLSRDFDKMHHALLIAKRKRYGVPVSACDLTISYLRNRNHRFKIMITNSEWATINRGIAEGSVLWPLLFDIFNNDLLYINMKSEPIYYADDYHMFWENKWHNGLKMCWKVTSNTATV